MLDNTEPLGLKLRALRKERQLSQAELGKVLGFSGRVISNIETARRQLTQAEVRKIESEYDLRLVDVDTSALRREEEDSSQIKIYTEAQFFDFQERFLNEHAAGSYDIWFLNSESLPMLESDRVQASWSQNISGGTHYRTIWIMDVINKISFPKFLERATEALNGARMPANGGRVNGSVHIYPLHLHSSPPDRVNEFASAYDTLRDELSKAAEGGVQVELHARLENLNWAARQFVTRFYFHSGSIVAYEPHSLLRDRAMLVLELKDVSNFTASESGRGYLVLGSKATEEFFRYLEEFKKSLDQEEPKARPKPTRGR